MVKDNREKNRFELALDGATAVAEYVREPGRVVFTHTYVPASLEGRGIGSTLVRTALDAVRAEGLRVVPVCPFFKAYIGKHPEYRDLVAPRLTEAG